MKNKENNETKKRSYKKTKKPKENTDTKNSNIDSKELLELKIEDLISELFNSIFLERDKLLESIEKNKDILYHYLSNLTKNKKKINNVNTIISPILIEENIKNLILGFLTNDNDVLSDVLKYYYNIITTFLNYITEENYNSLYIINNNTLFKEFNQNNNEYLYLDSLISLLIIIFYLMVYIKNKNEREVKIELSETKTTTTTIKTYNYNHKDILYNLSILLSKYKLERYPLSLLNQFSINNSGILRQSFLLFIHNYIINDIIYLLINLILLKEIQKKKSYKDESEEVGFLENISLFYNNFPESFLEKTISKIEEITKNNIKDLCRMIEKLIIKDSNDYNNSELIIEFGVYKLILVFLNHFIKNKV